MLAYPTGDNGSSAAIVDVEYVVVEAVPEMKWKLVLLWFYSGAGFFAPGSAVEFSEARVAGKRMTVCRVNVLKEDLRLFLYGHSMQPLKSFGASENWVRKDGRTVPFAMNAGMFKLDYSPVGLLVVAGRELSPLNTNSGTGNFFLKPNGVFLVSKSGAQVVESSEFLQVRAPINLATQSGPLLVQRGRIHPAFNSNSTSRLIRNGVGVPSSEFAVFAISEDPVNFYEFALLFRDVLHCPDALYLDGVISGLHAPALKRSDQKTSFGPMIGVCEPLVKAKERK